MDGDLIEVVNRLQASESILLHDLHHSAEFSQSQLESSWGLLAGGFEMPFEIVRLTGYRRALSWTE